jgi:hypothetical protein
MKIEKSVVGGRWSVARGKEDKAAVDRRAPGASRDRRMAKTCGSVWSACALAPLFGLVVHSRISSHLQAFTGNYSHLRTPSPGGIFWGDRRWQRADRGRRSRNAYSPSFFSSRFVTLCHGVSRLVTGFFRKKRLFIFMSQPQINLNQPSRRRPGEPRPSGSGKFPIKPIQGIPR